MAPHHSLSNPHHSHSHSNSNTATAYPPISSSRFSFRHILRPSVRLKTALYTLSLLITLLVILALNAASISSNPGPSSDPVLNTSPTHDSPADSGEGKKVAKGKDAHLVDEEIQRSFEEPDFALLSGKQPSAIGCDVPLEGADGGVLVFLGIFSTADRKDRRDL
jgi:hypothetical protein